MKHNTVVLEILYVLHCRTGQPKGSSLQGVAVLWGPGVRKHQEGILPGHFFLLAINLEEKSASCIPQGDRKGGSSPSAAPLVPLTPFFTASPSLHLYPVLFACSWHKTPAQRMLQKGAWSDCELKRDKVWGQVLINMFSHILPGSGILAGRRLWVSLSFSVQIYCMPEAEVWGMSPCSESERNTWGWASQVKTSVPQHNIKTWQ